MRKQLSALSLIIIVLVILSNTSLIKGYTPEYNVVEQISKIQDAVTFTIEDKYNVTLANLQTNNSRDTSALEKELVSDRVYIHILNQTVDKGSLDFLAVVYIQENETYFKNLNRVLLDEPNYSFLLDNGHREITPYTWQPFISNHSLINNSRGLDLSNFEDLRMSLADTYNSQTITHAGYFIALLAIVATLASKIDTIKKHFSRYTKFIFGVFIGLFFYSAYRLLYWSWLGSQVLVITEAEALSTWQSNAIYSIQNYLLGYFNTEHWLRGLYQLDKLSPLPLFPLIVVCIFSGIAVVYGISCLLGRSHKKKLLVILSTVILAVLVSFFNMVYLIPLIVAFYVVSFILIQDLDLEKRIMELEKKLKNEPS